MVALLRNQITAGFADLAAEILRLFRSPRTWLVPWWSGTVAKKFGTDREKSDIRTDCKLIPLLGKSFQPSTPFGQESVSRLLSFFARIWTVNILVEWKDLVDKAEMFPSLQQF